MAKPKSKPKLAFPDGFLWGAATAAHQVEGSQRNDWSKWEPTVAADLANNAEERLKGTVPRWNLIKDEAMSSENYISGIAANHYNRYEEDFDLMQSLGMNAYRFSVEWARIEPEPGKYDQSAINHYVQVIDALKARKIEPFVSLHHFTNPVWLDDLGGWHSSGVIERFADYASVLADNFGDKVKFWLTVNEPGSYLLMRYLGGGIWPKWPGMETSLWRGYKYLRNVVSAHNLATTTIKKINPSAQVGMVNGMVDFSKGRTDPFTLLQKKVNEYIPDRYLLDRTKEHLDFIGANYYVHMQVKAKLSSIREWTMLKMGKPINDMGWGVYPKGIYNVTQSLTKRYNLPIYITENGIPDRKDQFRKDFIETHLKHLHRSIQDGADARGYFYWSLLDNYEWSEGFWPKFGLIEVDRKTLKRRVRPSAKRYAEIIKNNSL